MLLLQHLLKLPRVDSALLTRSPFGIWCPVILNTLFLVVWRVESDHRVTALLALTAEIDSIQTMADQL